MSKDEQNAELQKWDWIPASQMLQTQINNQNVVLDLTPQIILTHPDGEQYQDPFVKLFIDTEKSLQYAEELGWNWHKSWNLPNISVRLEIKDAQTGDLLLSPKNVFAQLFAVKAVLENPQSFYLVDVGLRGTNKIELIDGQAFFSALRFASTSYNNEGVKFHLLLCIYIQNTENDIPKILNSTISPPIFVDSRKSARNLNERKLILFADPFTFENLDKDFVKRENKRKTEHDIKIDNDLEGLLNYLTAPNIRHKVKHPLFLSIRFSNSVKIFYNTTLMPNLNVKDKKFQFISKTKQVLEKLQTVLIKDHALKQNQSSNPQQGPSVIEEKQFVVFIDESSDQNKNKKINETVEYINCQSIEVIRKLTQLPSIFEQIGTSESILQSYKENFESLVILSKQLKLRYLKSYGNYESENSDDSDDNQSDSPPPEKKIKVDQVKQPVVTSAKKQASPAHIQEQPPQQFVDNVKIENDIKDQPPVQVPQQIQQPIVPQPQNSEPQRVVTTKSQVGNKPVNISLIQQQGQQGNEQQFQLERNQQQQEQMLQQMPYLFQQQQFNQMLLQQQMMMHQPEMMNQNMMNSNMMGQNMMNQNFMNPLLLQYQMMNPLMMMNNQQRMMGMQGMPAGVNPGQMNQWGQAFMQQQQLLLQQQQMLARMAQQQHQDKNVKEENN